jgi:hypothetical protein
VAAYFLPTLLLLFLWYDVIWGRGILYLETHAAFSHDDFVNFNTSGVVPSYFFVGTFLLYYGLGFFFVIAAVFSLLVCLLLRKHFSNFLVFDLICLATIVSIVSVNTFLGAGLNLSFPYNNAIKYNYQSLPFFSLLAASLASKCLSLFHSAKSKKKRSKLLFSSAAFIGLFLLAASIFANMHYVHLFSTSNYLLFRVEMDKELGYSLFNPTPIAADSPLMNIQYLGFAFVLSGLVWASRHKIVAPFKSIRRWIETKEALSRARYKNVS